MGYDDLSLFDPDVDAVSMYDKPLINDTLVNPTDPTVLSSSDYNNLDDLFSSPTSTRIVAIEDDIHDDIDGTSDDVLGFDTPYSLCSIAREIGDPSLAGKYLLIYI